MSSPNENNPTSLTSILNEVNSDTSSPSASSPMQVDSSVGNVASNNTATTVDNEVTFSTSSTAGVASLTSTLNEVNSDTAHDTSSPSASSPTQADSSVGNVAYNNTPVVNEGVVPAASTADVEQIDDDGVGPPLPVEMVASMLETVEDSEHPSGGGKNTVYGHSSRFEPIHNDIEPLHLYVMADSFEQPDTSDENITASTDWRHAAAANTRLVSMDKTSSLAPVPFNSADFEDGNNGMKKRIDTASDVDSIVPPPCYADQPEVERNLPSLMIRGRRFLMRVGWNTSTSIGPPANEKCR